MTSFIGIVQAVGTKPLLGGVRVHKSARYETYAQAEALCKGVQAINLRAGRRSRVDVNSVEGEPQISVKGFNLSPERQSSEIS